MPELPEVETVRRGLEPVLAGQLLKRVLVRRRDLRWPIPDSFESRLEGRRLEALERRAKFLIWRIEGGDCAILHLGMSGRFRIFEPGATAFETHDHVVFTTESGADVVFNDPRRFGMMTVTSGNALDIHPMLAGLGPEPLGPDFDAKLLAARLAVRHGPLKTALLDQSVVAGLGNIYVCEALFRAGLSPKRKASTVTGVRAERLAAAIRAVLAEAIAAGGSSLRDHRQPSGELGYFQHNFSVYDREGQPCPHCAGETEKPAVIRRIVQSGRSTFYCARCQR